MEQEIQYIDIQLTDIKLHTVKPTNPPSFARVIGKFLYNGLPGRIYSKLFLVKKSQTAEPKLQLTIPLSDEWAEKINALEKEGKKVRFIIPNGILPIYAGKDMVEFINAKKNRIAKRI